MIFLDENLGNIVVNGNEQASKIVGLYLIMKNNRLFSEFVEEVFITKAGSDNKSITKADIVVFLRRRNKKVEL